MSGAAGPLAGVRVVDLTTIVLGPLATQILGDAGADVIKVEAPEGDPTRAIGPRRSADMGAHFLNLNRNKRSVVLDLKSEEGRAALERLITTADVLVHNMRPGAAKRLGIDAETLCARHARLIHASASGFRLDGSRAEAPVYDDIIQGETGFAALNADARGPRYAPSVVADKITGHVLAQSIVMALFARERSGRGQAVHVPMFETFAAFLLSEHLWGFTLDGDPARLGYPRVLDPERRPFATADGHVCVVLVSDAQWTRLFAAMGIPETLADPRFATIRARADNTEALHALLAVHFRKRTTEAWLGMLSALDIAHGKVLGLRELPDDPGFRESGVFMAVEHPSEGRLRMMAPTVAFSATKLAVTRPAPRLGEHTDEVLTSLPPDHRKPDHRKPDHRKPDHRMPET
jgi:crotonobetainyl-CoA:carnitine CoA-transferase CaiB-like acyl-CoA transferase